jgi:hypothetical protein
MLTSSVTQEAISSDHYYAEHFGRVIIRGWQEQYLTPAQAFELGRLAGSYARRALAQDQQIANTLAKHEAIREMAANEIKGWQVIRGMR